jgi:CRISPR-associated protein Csh1
LFPNKYSHGEVDNKLYRKEIVTLYSSILKERKINYYYLISNFNFIFRKTFFNKEIKNDRDFLLFRPIKMNILISWLNKITKLEGGLNIMEGNSIVEITDNDVKEFFEIHKEIYSDNYFRQGLFLLGKLVNSILNEQKEKSSNFMDKINLEGIPVHRVRDLVFQVTDYLKIYKLFELENKTYSQMMDRLQGIENSNLSKDDVLFCILSGISFGRYLGTKYAALKDKNKDDINIKGEKNE